MSASSRRCCRCPTSSRSMSRLLRARRGQGGELAGVAAGAAQQGKRRRESTGDAGRAHDSSANAVARQRTRGKRQRGHGHEREAT
eukprot:4125991-Prymnesium_polylepis.1